MTSTSQPVVVIARGTRTRLHFSDYTEQYDQAYSTFWDGGSEWTEDVATDGPLTTDAETVEAVERFRDVYSWFCNRVYSLRPQFMAKPGDRVEVYKGRKVPKGVYVVRDSGKGNYGSYFNLLDSAGNVFTYVSADNCRRVITKEPYDGFILRAVEDCSYWRELPNINFATALLVMADRMDDDGDSRAATVRAWGESVQRRSVERSSRD